MEKYNVTKKWQINGKHYFAFVGVERGLLLQKAIETLRRVYFIESAQEFQYTELIDEDTYQFSVFKNGVEFVYSVEEDIPFQELAGIVRPSNCFLF